MQFKVFLVLLPFLSVAVTAPVNVNARSIEHGPVGIARRVDENAILNNGKGDLDQDAIWKRDSDEDAVWKRGSDEDALWKRSSDEDAVWRRGLDEDAVWKRGSDEDALW
ncbi:MAG: hypothetical protein Q9165_008638 [Trypethelium subeluteriae]